MINTLIDDLRNTFGDAVPTNNYEQGYDTFVNDLLTDLQVPDTDFDTYEDVIEFIKETYSKDVVDDFDEGYNKALEDVIDHINNEYA